MHTIVGKSLLGNNMKSNKIIDIDAEFDDVVFDEEAINRATGNLETIRKREANGWQQKNQQGVLKAKGNPIAQRNRAEANRKNASKESWIEANMQGVEKRINNDEAVLNHKKAMERVHANPMTAINRQKAIDNRNKNNTTWLENMVKNSAKAKFKPIVTPEGVFESLKSASEHYMIIYDNTFNYARYKLMKNVRNKVEGFFNITQEEYIMLTGKDI